MKLLKAIKNFLIDWIWQLPQNLCGLIYKECIHNDIETYIDSNVHNCEIYLKKSNGGVTLGKYIFIYKKTSNLTNTVLHEQGHVKQSLILGPLYLLVIGLPSIIWAATHKSIAPSKSYYWLYTESWANKLSKL